MNIKDEFIPQLKEELSKFDTSEELLRGGGLSIELLDRLAHGFAEPDIKTLHPSKLKVRWNADIENVEWEIENSKKTEKEWAKDIDLSEPIDVSYMKSEFLDEGFYIEDGHHRYTAARILNKPLKVNLEIKINPIIKISPELDYDTFHRKIFKFKE
jgi:hypothetical protein